MPMTKHVLVLLCVQALAITGALAAATAPHSPPPPPTVPSTAVRVTGNVRPVTVALLRPASSPSRRTPPHAAARVHPTARVTTSAPVRRAPHRTAVARPAPRLTFQQQVDRATARIHGYRPGSVIWVLQANDGHWGTADWYAHTIWVSPRVPSNRLFDVVVHEWSHLQSVAVYDGDVSTAVKEMSRYFGGGGLVGAERAADCMARLEGARWTHYTTCADARWRAGAARLLAGRRL